MITVRRLLIYLVREEKIACLLSLLKDFFSQEEKKMSCKPLKR